MPPRATQRTMRNSPRRGGIGELLSAWASWRTSCMPTTSRIWSARCGPGGSLARARPRAEQAQSELQGRVVRPGHLPAGVAADARVAPPRLDQAVADDAVEPGISGSGRALAEVRPAAPRDQESLVDDVV